MFRRSCCTDNNWNEDLSYNTTLQTRTSESISKKDNGQNDYIIDAYRKKKKKKKIFQTFILNRSRESYI